MTAVTAAPRGHQHPPLPDADLAAVLRYINDHDQGKGVDMSGGAGHPAVTPLRRARALSQLRDRGFIYKPSASPYNIKVRLTPQGRDWLDQYDQLQPERKEAMAPNSGATRAPFNKHAQPWWEQYQGFQAQHDDAIVLLQMGANYEAYGTQAAVLASVARQAIKTRPIAVGKHVEMALVARPQLRATCEALAAQGHPVVVIEASVGKNGTERKVALVFEPTAPSADIVPEAAAQADLVGEPESTTDNVPGESQPEAAIGTAAPPIEAGDFVCNRALKQTRIVREIQDAGRTLLVRSDELKADSGLWGWDASAVEVVIRMNSTTPETEAPASEEKPDGWTGGEDLPADLDTDEASYTDADWETKVAADERAVEAALDEAETGAAEAGMTPGELEAQVSAELTGEITPLSAAPPRAVPQIISVAPVQLLAAETIAATEALLAATQRDNKALRTQNADLQEQVAGNLLRIAALETQLKVAKDEAEAESQRAAEAASKAAKIELEAFKYLNDLAVVRGRRDNFKKLAAERLALIDALTATITRSHDRRARAQQYHRRIIQELRAAALDGAPAAEAARPKA